MYIYPDVHIVLAKDDESLIRVPGKEMYDITFSTQVPLDRGVKFLLKVRSSYK